MFRQDAYVMNTILTYANVAREAGESTRSMPCFWAHSPDRDIVVVLIFGGWVVFTRYKKQNDFLIRAIRRDGGAYLVVAFCELASIGYRSMRLTRD